MRQRDKGQATLIGLAVFTAIIVTGITLIIGVGTPLFEQVRDAKAIDNANNILTELLGDIRQVSSGGEGSHLETTLGFSRGRFVVDAEQDTIYYEIDTTAEIISPHTTKQLGNLRMSALANVKVSKTRRNGEDCWLMENEHVALCIRSIPEFVEDAIEVDTLGFWRFNEGTGSVATDNSSNGNNGTINGATWNTSGKVDDALEFDGSSDYVNITNDDALNVGSTSFTVSAWLNTQETGSTEFLEKQSGNPLYQLALDGSGHLRFDIRDSGGTLIRNDGSTTINDGNWHHVVGVRDTTNGTTTIYVDGEPDNTVIDTADSLTNTGHLLLGKDRTDTRFFDGLIDEVRIWNRSLTPEEVARLWRSDGRLDYIDTRHMILHYRNKDEGKNLSVQHELSLGTQFEAGFTRNGTGYAAPQLTGDNLGRGRITAQVRSFYGVDYTVEYKLLSGSDFLQIDVLPD